VRARGPDLPSTWFESHVGAVRDAAVLGPVVDLACGYGRHAAACGGLGLPTLAVDSDAAALRALQHASRGLRKPPWPVLADLEAECGIPIAEQSCGAILIFRFLYRPIAAAIAEALRPGGLLLYETFTVEQLRVGWGPRRAAFLLEPGELRRLFPALEVVAYEEGLQPEPDPGAPARAATARLAARRPHTRSPEVESR